MTKSVAMAPYCLNLPSTKIPMSFARWMAKTYMEAEQVLIWWVTVNEVE